MGNLQKGHGVAFSDIDNDGDQDIFLEVGGAYNGDSYLNSLYQNPGQNNNHWICLNLEGKTVNRAAIGSRIEIVYHENGQKKTVYKEVNSGGSFGASPLRQQIGIGQATMIDQIDIIWAGSSKKQVFNNIRPDQNLKIVEDEREPTKMNFKKIDFVMRQSHFQSCAPVQYY